MTTRELRIMNRFKGKDGRHGRCPHCGQFVGRWPADRHYRHRAKG